MQTCQLEAKQSEHDFRLLQITDTHLFAETTQDLIGINTAQSFQAVITQIEEKAVQFDAVIATGDLSQDQSVSSYLQFAKAIKAWQQPCFWLPGNHDALPTMAETLEKEGLCRCDSILLGEHWLLIMLDSQVKDMPHGYLSERQLQLIDKALLTHPDRYALLVLHHNPLPVGSKWLDKHQLANYETLWQHIEKHNKIQAMICGHVHQDFHQYFQGCHVFASPSTCFQFLPNSDDFMLDNKEPGWREIILHKDGAITTKVERIDSDQFLPNLKASGY